MRPWCFHSLLVAGQWGVLLQSQSWGQGHRDVGPNRLERRWDHVRKMTRDKDGLRERIRRRKMVWGGQRDP